MGYVGPIECPNCNCPISKSARTCPYCSSRIPMSVPWRKESLGIYVAVLAVVALTICSDHYLGTHVIETVRDFCSEHLSN